MSGTYQLTVGDRGRLVVPAAVRKAEGLTQGTNLVMMTTGNGIVLMTRDQLKHRVVGALAGASLVDELLEERRLESLSEDAG